MASPPEKKTGARPFFTLSRKAAAGWCVGLFVLSAWMFTMGVMVGRGTAPISYDIDRLKRTLESLQKSVQQQLPQYRRGLEAAEMKSKSDLEFYDKLRRNRDDTEVPNLSMPPPAAVKPEPPAPKPAESPASAKSEKQPPAPASAPAPANPEVPAAAAAPGPAPSTPADAASGKPLTVQIAAVKTEGEARRLLEKLRQRGYAAYVEPVGLGDKGTWYRVRMGEFPAKEFARSTVDRLQKDGFKPDVVAK